MCKVLIIPAIKEAKRKETNNFIYEMGLLMSKSNSDGLGYAAIDKDGNLFSERWLHNGHFGARPDATDTSGIDEKKELAEKTVSMFGKALSSRKSDARIYSLPTSKNYTKMGEGLWEKDAAAITLHTRMATCEKGLKNVHPFIDKDTSVIHNGVINNHKMFDLKLSTCDSESILISYLKQGIGKALDKTEAMAKELFGYYACGVFSRDAEGNRILDVFKANNNNLSIAFIFELDTYILTSSEYDIKSACETLGYTHGGIQDIENDFATRINPFTGEVISQVKFASNVSYWNENSHRKDSSWDNRANNVSKFPTTTGKKQVWDSGYFDMMKQKPSIRRLSDHEVMELSTEMMMRY